ncbi:MAG: hypothetical protein HY738_04575 [Bacteroidia bacterium]|nr:hypothetical protein [Bacteroidia bacterium]
MKKLIVITLCALMVIPVFNTCKKGENDPLLSFRSRKKRLVGEWQLTEWDRTYTYGSSTTITNFNGSIKTVTYGSGDPVTSSYTETMTIEDDGTFTIATTEITGGDTEQETIKGYWFFMDGNKEAEYKDKERVSFQMTEYSSSDGEDTDFYTSSGDAETLGIVRFSQLKKKEIIIETEITENNDGTNRTISETMTYERQ